MNRCSIAAVAVAITAKPVAVYAIASQHEGQKHRNDYANQNWPGMISKGDPKFRKKLHVFSYQLTETIL